MNRGFVYSIVSAICLGTLAIWIKMGLALGMEPVQIVQYRFFFGALLLFSWLGLTRPGLLRISRRGLVKALILGGMVYPVQSMLFATALETLPASTTSLIYYLYPLPTTLWAALFLKLRPGRVVALSLFLVLAGSGLVFHDAFARELDPAGMGFAVACMAVFSVYLTLIQLFIRTDEARRISVYVILFAGLVFTAVSPPTGLPGLPLRGWLVALGLGLIPTALAVSLVYRAVERVGSAYLSIFSTIEPVTTVLLSALFLGENVQAIQVAGMGCIVVGIVLPNAGLVRKRAAVEEEG